MTLDQIKEISDYSKLNYKFYEGYNLFPDIVTYRNNVIVDAIYKKNRTLCTELLLKIEDTFGIQEKNYLNNEELQKYAFSEVFLNVFGIYKCSIEEDDFFQKTREISYMYISNYEKFLNMKMLEQTIIDYFNGVKIEDPKTVEDFMIYISQGDITTDEFFILTEKINQLEDSQYKETLLEELDKRLMGEENSNLEVMVIESLLDNLLEAYRGLFASICKEIEYLNTTAMNAKFRYEKEQLPYEKTDLEYYGVFGPNTKHYKTLESSVELRESFYDKNYIKNGNKIVYCRGENATIFEEDNKDLTEEETEALKNYYNYIHKEILNVMLEMRTFQLFDRISQKYNLPESIYIKVNLIKDIIRGIDSLSSESLGQALVLLSKLDELIVAMRQLTKNFTPENMFNVRYFFEHMPEYYSDNYELLLNDLSSNNDEQVIRTILASGNTEVSAIQQTSSLNAIVGKESVSLMGHIQDLITSLKDSLKGLKGNTLDIVIGSFIISSIKEILQSLKCLVKGLMYSLKLIIGIIGGAFELLKNLIIGFVDILRDFYSIVVGVLATLYCMVTFIISGVSIAIEKMGDLISSAISAWGDVPSTSLTIGDYIDGALSYIDANTDYYLLKVEDALSSDNIKEAMDDIVKSLGTPIIDLTSNELTGKLSTIGKDGGFFEYFLGLAKDRSLLNISALIRTILEDTNLSSEDKSKAYTILLEYIKGCDDDLNGNNDVFNTNLIAETSANFISSLTIDSDFCDKNNPLASLKNGLLGTKQQIEKLLNEEC